MRLFIAIRLSEKMKETLMEAMRQLKRRGVQGHYTPVSNLHITICFIGETDELSLIKDAMNRTDFHPFSMSLSEPGNFGNLLWAGVQGERKLTDLSHELKKHLDEARISYDKKEFRPHITLIRKMQGNIEGFELQQTEMTVEGISLMKSERKKGQMVYTEIYRIEKN